MLFKVCLPVLAMLLMTGCMVSGNYSSDSLNITGYPCKVHITGKAIKVNAMDIECIGADPVSNVPSVLPAVK